MKYCCRCKELKPKTEYTVRDRKTGWLRSTCRSCNASRANRRKQELRQWFDQYKSNLSCEDCGIYHPAIIDFHHLDPSIKDGGVADFVARGRTKSTILTEIAKCKVLCSNCHRILHWNERNDNAV